MGGVLVFDKNEIRRRAEADREFRRRERDEARRKARKPRKSLVMGRIPEDFLRKAYLIEKKSMQEIAKKCSCSTHKIAYWITAYSIPVRNQSEAVYCANNKNGDPFSFNGKNISITDTSFLCGLGLGLYWSAGTVSGNSLRIGSADPKILRAFMHFLYAICGVDKKNLHFGLQVSSSKNIPESLLFWTKALSISRTQFQKPIITKSHRANNHKKAAQHGFVILYFYNSKLKRVIVDKIKKLNAARYT